MVVVVVSTLTVDARRSVKSMVEARRADILVETVQSKGEIHQNDGYAARAGFEHLLAVIFSQINIVYAVD